MTRPTYIPGQFCWNELATRDLVAAKKFYAAVPGWQLIDKPLPGDMGTYTHCQHLGQDVAGMYQIPGEMPADMPPAWMCYLWSDDVDATVAHAIRLGGRSMSPAMDIPGVGRVASLCDPTGATFGLFRGTEHPGAAQLGQEPNTFCWNEMLTTDPKRASEFYTALFGWNAQVMDMGANPYTMFLGEHGPAGGLMAQPAEMAGAPSAWFSYISVADCDASVQQAEALGATVLVPPTNVPTIGRFCTLLDPAGACVSVIRLENPAG